MGRNRKQRSILSFPPNSTPKTGLLSAIWAIIMPAFPRILSGLSSATTAPSFSIPMTPLLVNHSAICWTNKESSHYSFLFVPKLLISLPGRFGLFADWDSFWFCPLTPHCFVLPSSFFLVRCLHFLFVFFHFQVYQKKWSEAVHRLQHGIRGYPTCADLWEVFLICCYSFQFNLLLCYINLTLTYLKQFEFVVLFVFCWSRPWDLPISGWACLLPH